jgi:murein DD-endopeptidase MepM/ murein hydrolase activator NlpD
MKKRLYPKNKNKNWNTAMQLYNIQPDHHQLSIDYARFSVISPDKPSYINRWSSRIILLTGGLVAMGNVPVYSSVAHIIDTPKLAQTQIKKPFQLPAAPIASYSGYNEVLDDLSYSPQQGRWSIYSLNSSNTLSNVLNILQLKRLDEQLAQDKLIQYTLGRLEENSSVLFYKVDNQVQQLIYLPMKQDKKAFIVSRSNEIFAGEWRTDRVKLQRVSRRFSIKNSLYTDATRAKIPNKIIQKIPNIFKKDINFNRDISRGDKISLVYESIELDGEEISSRHLLAARYDKKNIRYQRVRYNLNDKTLYLSANGDDAELKKIAFVRRPIKGRLSSPFNPQRKHPIFRTIRPHNGTDYAASHGTPIYATAKGKIIFQGRKGGYGNVIDLSHQDSIKTRYGHMSGFNLQLQVGSPVERGDIIGYVGSTGNSTGNHVHYEFHVNGQAVNPETVELPTIGIMTQQEQTQFHKTSQVMLNALNKSNHIANIGADFSKSNRNQNTNTNANDG